MCDALFRALCFSQVFIIHESLSMKLPIKARGWYITYTIKLFLAFDYLQNATVTVRCFRICQVSQLNRVFITSNGLLRVIDFPVLFLPLGNTKINKSHRPSVGEECIYLKSSVNFCLLHYLICVKAHVPPWRDQFQSCWDSERRRCDTVINDRAAAVSDTRGHLGPLRLWYWLSQRSQGDSLHPWASSYTVLIYFLIFSGEKKYAKYKIMFKIVMRTFSFKSHKHIKDDLCFSDTRAEGRTVLLFLLLRFLFYLIHLKISGCSTLLINLSSSLVWITLHQKHYFL